MVVLTTGFDGLDILLLNSSFAGFGVADFRPRWIQYFVSTNAGFWPLPGQIVFFLASSGAECLPGVHSDVRA